ncbi:hypothetical protein EVAR_44205_1 [Eumeta japonica]|uniref:Uncharacterized protein n=1 Tax=Eumeta variegata TaxID=151549 RepID=A0A4C1W3N1_EUMVA|nr:hypothetical protein EVAR_44205_1 [Eumeta japonica]
MVACCFRFDCCRASDSGKDVAIEYLVSQDRPGKHSFKDLRKEILTKNDAVILDEITTQASAIDVVDRQLKTTVNILSTSRDKRAFELSKSRWSPSSMDTFNSKGVVSALPALGIEIGESELVEGEVGDEVGSEPTETLTVWTNTTAEAVL